MTDIVFHLSLAALYILITLEAGKLGHRRLAFCYGAVACLTFGFCVFGMVPSWPVPVEVWV